MVCQDYRTDLFSSVENRYGDAVILNRLCGNGRTGVWGSQLIWNRWIQDHLKPVRRPAHRRHQRLGSLNMEGMADLQGLCDTIAEPAEAGTPYPGTPGRVKLGDQTKDETAELR